jgi:hypothetical protein
MATRRRARRQKTRSSAKGAYRLPSSAFAYPKQRAYPINTVARRRNALARAAQPGTFGTKAHVERAIKRKYGKRSGVKSITKRMRKQTTHRRRR